MIRIPVDPSSQLAWALASRDASLSGSRLIEPLHVYSGILQLLDDLFQRTAEELQLTPASLEGLPEVIRAARQILGRSPEELTRMRRNIRQALRHDDPALPMRMLHRSAAARAIFERGARFAVESSAPALTAVHLLQAILEQRPADVARFLSPQDASRPPDTSPAPAAALETSLHLRKEKKSTPLLDEIGRDLTTLAKAGRLQEIVGRDKAIKSLARYLARTTKRNVIVLGEPGVGKTAVVEGLAQRLIRPNAPELLRDLRIVQVNVSDLMAGTRHRGDLESRLQDLVRECSSDPNLVLFLDEIHLVMKAGGGGESPLDIANILKPALAREDFRCVGATTTEEFERYVKADGAFLRRFQLLRLEEPGEEEALAVLVRWAKRIEEIQGVIFEEDALKAAVSLSARLIRGRALPDKAIDLLENAAVHVKVGSLSTRGVEIVKGSPRIGRAEIVAVLEDQYGISASVGSVIQPGAVGSALRNALVGQDAAARALEEALGGIAARGDAQARPLGVFLFTGPTGVGKTHAAELLAETLFGDRSALGRFNMNEFKERHELARLIGAPPGYVGHGPPGALFRHLGAHPQGLILLDEMEKAHPEIQDYFLQIFDKGMAADAQGRAADFRRQVVVMTCNVSLDRGSDVVAGFGKADPPATPERAESGSRLREVFRSEFLGRVDRIIWFRALDEGDFTALLDRRLEALEVELGKSGSSLEIAEDAHGFLRDACASAGGGARAFIHAFERILVAPVLERAGRTPGVAMTAEWADGRLCLKT